MKKYWLHRIKGGKNGYQFSKPLLEKYGFLSIGFSDFSSVVNLITIKDSGFKAIDDLMNKAWGGLSSSRHSLSRFICEMKPGDYVLVPAYKEFSVYEICDDTVYCNENMDSELFVDWNGQKASFINGKLVMDNGSGVVDLGFYRKVKPVCEHISRADYAGQQLISRMKIMQTNANISDLKEEIDNAINRFKNKNPINLKAEMSNTLIPSIVKIINQLADADKFENLVIKYFESLGAVVSHPSKRECSTEDGDADCIARFEAIRTIIRVQVKKHQDTTDNWCVQQIQAYSKSHEYEEEDGLHYQKWVISAAKSFSEDARRNAVIHDVLLITGDEFAEMLLNAGLGKIDL